MGTTRPDNGFVAHCMELLAVLGPIRAKRMFGGHGLYADDIFVAIITGDQLYLKTDDQTRPRFEAAGCAEFRYDRRAKDGSVTTASLGYYQPPEEALESAALMAPWARLSMEAALRSANAKPKPKPTPKAKAKPKPPAAEKSPVALKPSSGAAATSAAGSRSASKGQKLR
ncbi:TfoX/Sxy family protein [Roseateles depolymerans]|uniref:Regulator of competence-specific genes-like protein n=1 Tax=Roseateles depolymerans TaxID=76731 RepID=A0A0U3MLI1_9BURK|nr:TfoX/Sxy family protein [Roseateles depolymerans]ALV05146.1 Regulator of competence-specific genes-like protein [Roseateles depolymerans]REG14838.1 DNA transformation protein [Roseateles depolymerans]